MVFVSPLLMGGKSVMVEVASGGKRGRPQAVEVHAGTAAARCRRTPAERVPMLLVVPSLLDWAGGQVRGGRVEPMTR